MGDGIEALLCHASSCLTLGLTSGKTHSLLPVDREAPQPRGPCQGYGRTELAGGQPSLVSDLAGPGCPAPRSPAPSGGRPGLESRDLGCHQVAVGP